MNDKEAYLIIEFDPYFPENYIFTKNTCPCEIIFSPKYVLIDGVNLVHSVLRLISGTKFHKKDDKLIFTNGDNQFTRSCTGVLKVYESETKKVLWERIKEEAMEIAVEIKQGSRLFKSLLKFARLRAITSVFLHDSDNDDGINDTSRTQQRIVDIGKHEEKLDSLEIAELLGSDLMVSWGMIKAFDKTLLHIIFREGTEFSFKEGALTLKNNEQATLLPIEDVKRILDEETGKVLWERP
ncbi:MAG: hypothetical protein HQ536_03545 [Parcubacteria group bacterium]|nr:hypothetical protein [Parcubacteria group bacterium]